MAALLTLTLPSFSTTIIPSRLPYNGTNYFVSDKSRAHSIRRSCRLIVRCSQQELNRRQFPSDFKFGASTSAFQTESSANDGGRGDSSIDYLLEGEAAANSLHKYNEDVLCLKNMSMGVYRMSISWPRLFPEGKVIEERVNREGVEFYKKLLSQLELNGIEPFVTLFHFDLPNALQLEYGGTLGVEFVDDFNDYATYCFKTFGDQVKYWTTINEPHIWSTKAYRGGFRKNNQKYDETTYPYIIGHNLIKAHAKAVNTYGKHFQKRQNGKIGISLDAQWFLPFSNTRADKDAVGRAWDFTTGWFIDPIVHGDYPFIMKAILQDRLPSFCAGDNTMIQHSYDFIAINYYTSYFAKSVPILDNEVSTGPEFDHHVEFKEHSLGSNTTLGPVVEAGGKRMIVYPEGLYQNLKYIKEEYNDPLIFITENGLPLPRDDTMPIEEALQDDLRVDYIKDHLRSVVKSLNDGVRVSGYFIWMLMDCVEFADEGSYTIRFGLNYTDYKKNYNRIPKKSANWLKKFLTRPLSHTVAEPLHPIDSLERSEKAAESSV